MANYSLVVGSKFKPFSYQELLAPALMATQAHRELEEAYADLGLKSELLGALTEGSPKAKEQYRKYAEDLAKEAEELSKYGLQLSSNQNMLNMRGRYAKEIIPIEQAYKRRETQAEEQRKALLNNPSLLFNRKAADTNLDAYLANPMLGYDIYSGALLEQQVADAATALSKAAATDAGVQKTLMNNLLPYQYETIRQSGFSPDVVRATIMGTEGGSKILQQLVDDTITASNIGNWKYDSDLDKENTLKAARAWANRGLWKSVGETKYGNLTDEYGMKTALNTQEFNNASKLARIKNEGKDGDSSGNLPYRRIANTQVQGETDELFKDLEFLNKLANNGGMGQFSKKKKTLEYSPITRAYMGSSYGGTSGQSKKIEEILSDYDIAKSKYMKIAKKYGINGASWGPNANKALIDKVKKDIKKNITRSQVYQINQTDEALIAEVLGKNSNVLSTTNRNRTGLKEIDDKGRVKDELTSDEVAKIFSKGKQHNLNYDPSTGFRLSYIDDDDKFKSVHVDPELLNFGDAEVTAAHSQIQSYLDNADYENANDLIDEMMTGLYYRFNTLAPKQSNTSTEIK